MKSALFSLALLIAGAGFVQPSFAATEEPAPAASEPAKPKPVKHKAHRHHHGHEKHSMLLKAHKA